MLITHTQQEPLPSLSPSIAFGWCGLAPKPSIAFGWCGRAGEASTRAQFLAMGTLTAMSQHSLRVVRAGPSKPSGGAGGRARHPRELIS
jgi:hypothetical protein